MADINGFVEAGFEAVQAAFERNFAEQAEVGAGLAVRHRGRVVVELSGGLADPDAGTPWRPDTLVAIASTTKTMAVVSALLLVERGMLDLDTPIAAYWPEFAAEGKASITVRMLLSHRSGVVSLAHRPMTYQDLAAGTPIFEAIAAARPEWEPGTAHGYHGVTIGHTLSAVIQRVTGRTVGPFFATEIAGPLGLDCFVGLPEAELPRLAKLVMPEVAGDVVLGSQLPEMRGLYKKLEDPDSLTYRAFYGSFLIGWESVNDPAYVRVEAPSTDGVASAVGLARFFGALIGEVDGIRLLGPELVDQARRVHSTGLDRVLDLRTDWGLGFMLPGGPFVPAALPAGAFGHGGATGSFAFADPEHELAFGYTPNRGSELLEGNDFRVSTLVEAVYGSLPGRTG
ncbi:serine hydrolase domain-containing protein [Amycolatopsis nigrescens]|uniref:serine hydrolase domain-containing protein n=1 Tax=Amycolatopsis nigrescens TaxID=381445 RepID=UPI0003652A04|nr:serine hydrolase domain-containing protein [Amycolatopsis nigrescens]